MINLIMKISVVVRHPGIALISIGIFAIAISSILSALPYMQNTGGLSIAGYLVIFLGTIFTFFGRL